MEKDTTRRTVVDLDGTIYHQDPDRQGWTGETHPFLNKCMNTPRVQPLQHIQLDNLLELGGGLDSPYKLACSIYARVMDTTDRVIVDACIEYAKAAGISDLYLLDREFVKAALLEKAERMKNAGRCCVYCGQRIEEAQP